jgi:hypothetical protein
MSKGSSSEWKFREHEITDDLLEKILTSGFIGFIYEITEIESGMKYIGKKMLVRKTKRKIKSKNGVSRNKIVWKESDWRGYHGSSPILMERVSSGKYKYHREILLFCNGKADLMYYEMKYQMDRNVIFDDNYYNQMLHVRCTSKGITLPDELEKQNEEILNDN